MLCFIFASWFTGITHELRTNITKNIKHNRNMKQKIYRVSKERAVTIAANHNCVSTEIAKTYTDSELREILRHLGLKANF